MSDIKNNNSNEALENIRIEKETYPRTLQDLKPDVSTIIKKIFYFLGGLAALVTFAWFVYSLLESLDTLLLRVLADILICLLVAIVIFFIVMNNAFRNAKTIYDNIRIDYEKLKIRFDELDSDYKTLQNDLVNLSSIKTKAVTLEKENRNLKNKIEEKDKELKNLEKTYRNKIEEKLQEIKGLEFEKQNLIDKVNEFKGKLDLEKNKNNEMQRKIEQYKKMLNDAKIKPIINFEYDVKNIGMLWWADKEHYITIKNDGYGDALSVSLNIRFDNGQQKIIPLAEILKKGEGKNVYIGNNKTLNGINSVTVSAKYQDIYENNYESRSIRYNLQNNLKEEYTK